MTSHIADIIFLISTLLAASGLIYIIYSRSPQNRSSKLFLLTLILVIGYMFSHGFHFLIMKTGDVTILDRSCHSFLLLIAVTLTFFARDFPKEQKLNKIVLSVILIPTLIILILLWTGYFVAVSHAHHAHFTPGFTPLYPIFIFWYIFLVGLSSYFIFKKLTAEKSPKLKMQLLMFFFGLIITNLTSFIFGMFIPWITGFYYLVEASPLAFLAGVILFTAFAISKYDMFPIDFSKVRNLSLNKKLLLISLILVPIIILLIQIPVGRIILDIKKEVLFNYFLISIFGGVTVSVTMALLINMFISYPLRELKNKAKEIERGNYNVSVNISSNDELGELAETFSDMAKTLNKNAIELLSREEKIITLLNAFEKSMAAIVITDADNNIIEANNKFCSLINKNNISEIINKSIFEIHLNKFHADSFEKIKTAILSKSGLENEFTINHSENEQYLFVSMSPIYLANNQFNGFIYVEVNITEKMNLEKKLHNAEKLASLGQMSAILAHEIKTPLTSIKMNADILAEVLNLSEEDKSSFEIIQKEIKRLNNLVKEVLQFSRQQDLVYIWFYIDELIEDIKLQLFPKINDKHIELQIISPHIKINADSEKLKQVILNMIENSSESINKDGFIKINVINQETNLVLLITDNGSGIKDKEKIFAPFFTTKSSGTGLGLSISQNIIERHGGKLELSESSPEKTTFKIIIPRQL
ncbi:MAG: ATP-binding protein [bacterium]